MSAPVHTPTPWFVGCQNDALFIVSGRPPALNNDHPWHEAPRVAVARVYGPAEGDCLPVNADANAAFIVRAVNSHEALVEALSNLVGVIDECQDIDPINSDYYAAARAAISLAKGEDQ